MASCVKCGNGTFKMVEQNVSGSRVVLNLISCSACDSIAGVYDVFPLANVLDKLDKHAEAIKSIAARIGADVDL
jgi:hypothetical protein